MINHERLIPSDAERLDTPEKHDLEQLLRSNIGLLSDTSQLDIALQNLSALGISFEGIESGRINRRPRIIWMNDLEGIRVPTVIQAELRPRSHKKVIETISITQMTREQVRQLGLGYTGVFGLQKFLDSPPVIRFDHVQNFINEITTFRQGDDEIPNMYRADAKIEENDEDFLKKTQSRFTGRD